MRMLGKECVVLLFHKEYASLRVNKTDFSSTVKSVSLKCELINTAKSIYNYIFCLLFLNFISLIAPSPTPLLRQWHSQIQDKLEIMTEN